MSHRIVALGTAILISSITFVTLLTGTYMTFQGINLVGVIAAITVAAIGIIWFRKTSRQNYRQKNAE